MGVGVRLARVGALVLAAAGLLCLGMWLGGDPQRLPEPLRSVFVERGTRRISDLLERVRGDYFRPVARDDLIIGALHGVPASLHDPYSAYFDPAAFERLRASFSAAGSFVGVGLALVPTANGMRIARVFAGSPAMRAGLRTGELITAVDGQALRGEPADLAAAELAGPLGSTVSLTLRGGTGQPTTLRLTRARVADPSVSARTISYHGRRYLRVRITRFAADTAAKLNSALAAARSTGVAGVVLDLRANSGGLVEQALAAASDFLPRGAALVSLRRRGAARHLFRSAGGSFATGLALVELTDRATISAGEIFTGALKDNHRALIVGEPTFGKGVFQELVALPEGGGLQLTIGRYYTPDGTNLGAGGTARGAGVRPDITAGTNQLGVALRELSLGRAPTAWRR